MKRRRSSGRKKTNRKTSSWNVSSSKWSTVSKRSKSKRLPSAWNNHLMAVYRSMKAKDSSVKFGDAMKAAAKELDIKIVWGGDWKKFPDGPHFQLDWKAYPCD